MSKDDYDIGKIFSDMELELIKKMQKTLSYHTAWEQSEGFNWTQWQALKIRQLKNYRKQNKAIMANYTNHIDSNVRAALEKQFAEGGRKTDKEFTKAVEKGFAVKNKPDNESFFGINNRKLDSLIKSVQNDFGKAEHNVLRMMDDAYRQTIYRSHVFVNMGAGTLKQAVDMATRDFLAKGINNIVYKDGKHVNIASYAEMAVRTANKRAHLMGEGERRKEWGESLVLISDYNQCSPICLPWQGKVYVDDICSGGKAGDYDSKYKLLSTAVAAGLFHPNCRHTSSTFFEGINDEPNPPEEPEIRGNYEREQRKREIERNIKKYRRLEAGSLDDKNKAKYSNKIKEWQAKLENIDKYGRIPEKPRYEFTVAENIKDANSFAKDVLGIPNAEYKGVDLTIANEWNKGLTESFNRFPELKNNFDFVGTAQERNKYIKNRLAPEVMSKYKQLNPDCTEKELEPHVKKYLNKLVPKVKSGTMAVSLNYKYGSGITINDYYGDSNKLNETLKYLVNSKQSPVGANSIKSLVDHEIGHQLDNLLGVSKQQNIQELYDKMTTDEITNNLSSYAWNNSNSNKYGEFIAEGWAEYLNNPDPRPVAKEIGTTIERRYKEWKSQK